MILIHDPTLNLEPTTHIKLEYDFLDLEIKLNRNLIVPSLFNKTDSYKFRVLRYFNFHSNINTKSGLNTMAGKISFFLERVACILISRTELSS